MTRTSTNTLNQVPLWPVQADEQLIPKASEHPTPVLQVADERGMLWCNEQVALYHYRRTPVDPRSKPFGYIVCLHDRRVGCLIFGRPQATYVRSWYGSLEAKRTGRVRLSYWEVLNLARIYLHQDVQQGGSWCRAGIVPGFIDRDGIWHSSLASVVITRAIDCIAVDYLLCYPPCFLEQPYALVDLISYCDTRQPGHRGIIYESAGFRVQRTNSHGLRTYSRELRELRSSEDAYIRQAALQSRRSQTYRARRRTAEEWRQLVL